MQLDLFGGVQRGSVGLDELFAAYLECRRNKRRTTNALAFEVDFEQKLIELWKDVNNGTYMPGRSIAFIVTEPVQREVFAADFRDRIIHHLIIGKLNHLFEASFIQDSYSCRDGKGTQYGIGRVAGFIRECSRNYTKDCYILKMDIQSFFMSIDKNLLYKYLREFILARYHEPDQLLILELVEKVVFNDPEQNCHIKGRRSDWDGLPPSKSLFTSGKGKGLPIGNLTSQIFANFYLNFFDHYVKYDLGIEYYGRYVSAAFFKGRQVYRCGGQARPRIYRQPHQRKPVCQNSLLQQRGGKKSAQGQKTAARPAGQRQFVSGFYDSLQNVQNPPPFARKGA